ncbi:DNA repair RAD52-like protein 1, mitochondrial [Impatiens glandulifera]|uniref:DNA repair RAD52-like protein 1, mitochondrial n=1 Tax=Impatiens glandulifera TaxID=253017 RepID=UPI001FB16734|nr:DNA repair RAD52-like protein 1, mitochondrial [Impatiens glandulifera]
MASSLRNIRHVIVKSLTYTYSSPPKSFLGLRNSFCNFYASKASKLERVQQPIEITDDIPTSGISRPLSEILKELNKKVPDTLLKVRVEPDGFSAKYLPWHIANRILNLHAPEWSGEVRSITYSADGKTVSVVYRVTLYGTDAEMHRESTGTAQVNVQGYGNAVQFAESMAFRRACARFGLGLHLYHEDMS